MTLVVIAPPAKMTYAEILIKKGKRGAAAFVQAECIAAKAAAGASAAQSPEVLQTPVHLQVIRNKVVKGFYCLSTYP